MSFRVPRCFKSLSTRLLALTAIWVSFIVASIGYTMMLNWQLEASAAAVQTVSDLRYLAFRIVLATNNREENALSFEKEIDTFQKQLGLLVKSDPWKPLVVPHTPEIQDSLHGLIRQWENDIRPFLELARKNQEYVPMSRIKLFVEQWSAFATQIENSRAYYQWQLKYLQVLLIVLAIGSLFAIMGLLLLWVIRPLERIGAGIQKLSAGNLTARVTDVTSDDEVGRIASGFNHMAERLSDLYNNLEQKVAEKTATVEEKNRHLAQLYEMTAYFAQQRPLDEMMDGFVERIMKYTGADACAVRMIDAKQRVLTLVASEGLPDSSVEEESILSLEGSLCEDVLERSYPVRYVLSELDDTFSEIEPLRPEFTIAYSFQIRNAGSNIGMFSLLYRRDEVLSSQITRLVESFAMHLGVAVENRRLIERDRQYAVVQERQLLAQGLHDSIAQALSFLNLQVQFLSDAIKDNDKALTDESLAAIRTGVQECYEDVRELLLNFRERLHKEGFVDGVRTVMSRFEAQAHVQARLKVSGNGPELTEKQTLQVIFIVQEALSNVRKHAHASNVVVRIENRDDFVLTILDDGLGLDASLVQARKGQHVGLSIMCERAARIGASVSVERATPEGGTRVTLRLPADKRMVE